MRVFHTSHLLALYCPVIIFSLLSPFFSHFALLYSSTTFYFSFPFLVFLQTHPIPLSIILFLILHSLSNSSVRKVSFLSALLPSFIIFSVLPFRFYMLILLSLFLLPPFLLFFRPVSTIRSLCRLVMPSSGMTLLSEFFLCLFGSPEYNQFIICSH